MLKKLLILAVLATCLLGSSTAQALPNLQIYVDGATWDAGTQTWVISSPTFKLWVISDGSIVNDVKLVAAFNTGEAGSIAISGSTTGSAVFTDLSPADDP